jgi:hypothetical protein
MLVRNHILIAGTGRAGTSLLVRIFDACGFETEISRQHGKIFWDENANAGIESLPFVGDDHPYVVKSPWSYQFIEELLERSDITFDAVYVPIRNLVDATASRIVLDLEHRYEQNISTLHVGSTWRDWGTAPGGVTYSLEPLDQARILAHSFHCLIEVLARQEIPIKFLAFPRFVDDTAYLYRALGEIIQSKMSLEDFHGRVLPIIDPKLVRIRGQPCQQTECSTSLDMVRLPDFDTLDRTALKRRLIKLTAKYKKLRRRTLAGRIRQFKNFLSTPVKGR